MPPTILHSPEIVDAQTLEMLEQMVSAPWFYHLDLVGTLAFAISGAIKAYKLDYDYFGTFLLVLLPAVGGGTLRDVLVGGDRSPPFIFNDPTYLFIVFAVTALAIVLSRFYHPAHKMNSPLQKALDFSDTIGVAAFTIIGAKVAISAHLDWFWAPILAALTCSGGSIISNSVTGHESDALMGELYEEVAVAGGLVLVAGMTLAHLVSDPAGFMFAWMIGTMLFTFTLRWYVLRHNLVSPTLRTGLWDAHHVRRPAQD